MQTVVALPVKNPLDPMEKTLDSLSGKVLSHHMRKIIICDNGSTEDIEQVLTRFACRLPNVQLFRPPARGPAADRNVGFRSTEESSSEEIFSC
jgi:glycosyltransferase involved in cell wall biosynthesis